MALSGVTSWTQNRNQLIEDALDKIQALAEGDTPTARDYTKAGSTLNNIVAYLAAKCAMPTWKRTPRNISLVAGASTANIPEGKKVLEVELTDIAGEVLYPLQQKPFEDIISMPSYSTGVPVYWSATYSGLTESAVVFWPKPSAVEVAQYKLRAWYQDSFDMFTTATDDLDFPNHWNLAIVYKLCEILGPDYGLPLEDIQVFAKQAEEYIKGAEGYSIDDTSVYIVPTYRR